MEEGTTPNISSMNRLRDERSDAESLIKGDDVQRLSEILAGRTEPPTKPPS